MLELNPKLYYLKKFSIRMVRADPDPDVHDQLRVHGDAAGAVLDHAGGALRGVQGPGQGPLPRHRGESHRQVGKVSEAPVDISHLS